MTALEFLLVHMGMLLIDPKVALTVAQILISGLAPWQLFAVSLGIIAFWLLILVSILGRIRTKLTKAENTSFQRVHLLAYAPWPFATAHYILAGTSAKASCSTRSNFNSLSTARAPPIATNCGIISP